MDMIRSSLLLVLLVGRVLAVPTSSACICSQFPSQRKYSQLHSKSTSNVLFEDCPVETTGRNYHRPKGKPTVHEGASKDQIVSSLECESEQIHLSLGNSISSMTVSFASKSFNSEVYWSTNEADLKVGDMNALSDSDFTPSTSNTGLHVASGYYRSYNELYYYIHNLVDPTMGKPIATEEEIRELQDTSDWAFDPVTGEHFYNWRNVTQMQFGFGSYNNPDMYYQSPLLHTVELTDLVGGQEYFYRVSDSCTIMRFRMPYYFYTGSTETEKKSLYPFSVGLTGDLGQTDVSLKSMEALAALEADAVFLVGDLSYADGYGNSWDTFGRAFEAVASQVPVLTTGGNHEVQSGEANLPYQLRYPTPYQGSGSPDPAYWGREVGPLHVIALNAYAESSNSSLQYRWLEDYLKNMVNRDRTPWVMVMIHTAWYCSNTVHWKESERMRLDMEPMLYSFGVDIVLAGHVHAYERTAAVYSESVNECGISYLVLGDGGNYEGEVTPWRETSDSASGAPSWSAFRESSFGVGELTIVNQTHAFYSWHRHACGSDSAADYHMNFSSDCYSPGDNSVQKMETSDMTWFVRPDKQSCPNRHVSSSHEVYPQSDPSHAEEDDDFDFLSKEALMVILVSLFVLCLALLITIAFLWNKLSVSEYDLESIHKGDYKAVVDEA